MKKIYNLKIDKLFGRAGIAEDTGEEQKRLLKGRVFTERK